MKPDLSRDYLKEFYLIDCIITIPEKSMLISNYVRFNVNDK